MLSPGGLLSCTLGWQGGSSTEHTKALGYGAERARRTAEPCMALIDRWEVSRLPHQPLRGSRASCFSQLRLQGEGLHTKRVRTVCVGVRHDPKLPRDTGTLAGRQLPAGVAWAWPPEGAACSQPSHAATHREMSFSTLPCGQTGLSGPSQCFPNLTLLHVAPSERTLPREMRCPGRRSVYVEHARVQEPEAGTLSYLLQV